MELEGVGGLSCVYGSGTVRIVGVMLADVIVHCIEKRRNV